MNQGKNLVYPVDGGPIYFESDFSAFIAEPWNMATAIVFILIAAYWINKSLNQKKRTPFIFYASILLLIGGIGGSLYHGFRNSQITLMMDWLPILLLCLGASIYFIRLSFGSWIPSTTAVLGLVALESLNWSFVPERLATNVSYSIMALTVLIPTFLILRKMAFQGWQNIVLAFVFFAMALFFRIVDKQGILPMGTHFLWHTFGAVATFFMFRFVWILEKRSKLAPNN